MDRVVYKYGVMPGYNLLNIPVGSKIVHVGEQNYGLYIWVEQDPSRPIEYKTINVYGTGDAIRNQHEHHVGSVVTQNGLVWHVYEMM